MNTARNLFTQLAQPMIEGFAWGVGAKEQDPPYGPFLEGYAEALVTAELVHGLAELNLEATGADFIDRVDALVDQHKAFEPIREFLIDLALVQVLDSGKEDPDFFEGEVWTAVEAQTEDRGTELLNLLIYLRDCHFNEIKPSLEDFLFEFLLVEEDDHQDEHFIYESMIKNQELLQGAVEAMVEVGNGQKEDMEELFTPSMVFFLRSEKKAGKMSFAILEKSHLPGIHMGIYRCLSFVKEAMAKLDG